MDSETNTIGHFVGQGCKFLFLPDGQLVNDA